MSNSDTIAAIATAAGRGGVAVVRVSGNDAFQIAERLTGRRITPERAGTFFHGEFRNGSQVIDDGLTLVFAAPHSYTGENVIEFQGHGGSIAPQRVLEACFAAGARLARRGEFTQRAFLNGRLDLGAAEAVIDLVDARTARAADDALSRLNGETARSLEKLYLSAIDISSLIEHALDFDEGELPPDFDERVRNQTTALLDQVNAKLSTAREGRILREGALVVLAGKPNAGKSSLMNALLGENRAIVSPQAGTTRDSIEEWLDIDGWPVRLVDTAGLRHTNAAIEAEGVSRAQTLISQADLILHLTPFGDRDCPHPSMHFSLCAMHSETYRDCPRLFDENVIEVKSKCDLAEEKYDGDGVAISAKTGFGLDKLRTILASKLSKLAEKSAEESGADITTRQKECLLASKDALGRTIASLDSFDWVVAANEVRSAAESLGKILGKVYSDDLLDALFSRFCIGK